MILWIVLMTFVGTASPLKDVFANDIDGKKESRYPYSNHPKLKNNSFQQKQPDEKENLDSYDKKHKDFFYKDEFNRNVEERKRDDTSFRRGNQHKHNNPQPAGKYHRNFLHRDPERYFRNGKSGEADFSTNLNENENKSRYKSSSDASVPQVEPYIKNETKKHALENQFHLKSQPGSFKDDTYNSEIKFPQPKSGTKAKTSRATRQPKNQSHPQGQRKRQNQSLKDDEHNKYKLNTNKRQNTDKSQEKIKHNSLPKFSNKDYSRFKDKEDLKSNIVRKHMTPSPRQTENEFIEDHTDQQSEQNMREPFDEGEVEEMEHDVKRSEGNLIGGLDRFSISDPDFKDVEKRQESEDTTEPVVGDKSNNSDDSTDEAFSDTEKSYEYDAYVTTEDNNVANFRQSNYDDFTYTSPEAKRSLKFLPSPGLKEDTDSTIQTEEITHINDRNNDFSENKTIDTKRQVSKSPIEGILASESSVNIRNLPISKRSKDNNYHEIPLNDANRQDKVNLNEAKTENDKEILLTDPFTEIPDNSDSQDESRLGSENKINNFKSAPHARAINRKSKDNFRKHSAKEYKNYNMQEINEPNLNKWFKKEMSDIEAPISKTKRKKLKKMKSPKSKYWSKNRFSSRKPGSKKNPNHFGDNFFKKKSKVNQVDRKISNLKNDRNLVPNKQRFLKEASYGAGNNKREEPIFKDEKNRFQYKPTNSTKDVKRDQQTDSLVKGPDLIDNANDVLSEAIIESPHVDEKMARTVEDIKTRQTILKDKNLNKETNIVENEKEKVRDAIHLVGDNKVNSMEELSTDNEVINKKFPLSDKTRNKGTVKQPKTKKITGSNKNNKFGISFTKSKAKSPYSTKPIQTNPQKINFANKNFDLGSSMPNKKQTTVDGVRSSEPDVNNVFKNGELILITTGAPNLELQTDYKEDLTQESKIDPFGQVNDYAGSENEDLEYGRKEEEEQTDQSGSEVDNSDYDYGNTLSQTLSDQDSLDGVEDPRVRESFEYSTEMLNASGQEEFFKEEKVQKESKTLLRNKDTFKNETSKLKGERKSEIKNNKESYHESFLKEKDENKYPSLNDGSENRKKSIPKEQEIEANQEDYFETDMDPSRREMSQPNTFTKTQVGTKQKGKNSKPKPNEPDKAGIYDYPQYEDYSAQDDDKIKDDEFDYGNYRSDYGDMNEEESYIDDIQNKRDAKVLRKSVGENSAAVFRENRNSFGNDEARPYNLDPGNEQLIEKRMEFNKLKEPPSSSFSSQLASSSLNEQSATSNKIIEESAGNVIYMPLSTTTSHYNDFLQIREDKKFSHKRHIDTD